MEKKEVRIESPVTVAGITLIPVSRVSLSYWQRESGISCFGVRQPVSVAVISLSAKKAFRITGEEILLDQLMQEVPGMQEVVENISSFGY